MARLTFTPTAGLTIAGLTPDDGPKSTVNITASFNGTTVDAGDYVTQTFIVNAGTTITAIDLGKITTGKLLWIECDGLLEVTVTQDAGAGASARDYVVDSFMLLKSAFTTLSVANPGGTAVNLSVNVLGDRAAVGAGPGVF